jgi:hypothetical protein
MMAGERLEHGGHRGPQRNTTWVDTLWISPVFPSVFCG